MASTDSAVGFSHGQILGISLGLAVVLFLVGAGITSFESLEAAGPLAAVGLLFYPLLRILTELQRIRVALADG